MLIEIPTVVITKTILIIIIQFSNGNVYYLEHDKRQGQVTPLFAEEICLRSKRSIEKMWVDNPNGKLLKIACE